jgi:hypothetical protein
VNVGVHRCGDVRVGSNGEFSTGQTLSALLSQADFSRLDGLVGYGPQADSCTAQFFVSLDHLVGAAKQRCRDLDAELFCRLEIYCRFELGRLHDLQFRGLFALQDPADMDTCLPPCVRQIGAVADKATGNKANT